MNFHRIPSVAKMTHDLKIQPKGAKPGESYKIGRSDSPTWRSLSHRGLSSDLRTNSPNRNRDANIQRPFYQKLLGTAACLLRTRALSGTCSSGVRTQLVDGWGDARIVRSTRGPRRHVKLRCEQPSAHNPPDRVLLGARRNVERSWRSLSSARATPPLVSSRQLGRMDASYSPTTLQDECQLRITK
jgi:hypothetical protein